MLRHCPIPRFSSSGARAKMPNAASEKEKAVRVPQESQALDLPDPKDIASKSLPPQKVLKIFSINIIAQGLPFCHRRVSGVRHQRGMHFGFSLITDPEISEITAEARAHSQADSKCLLNNYTVNNYRDLLNNAEQLQMFAE